MKMTQRADRALLLTVFGLLLAGFFILASASMGLLIRSGGVNYSDVVLQQVVYGLVGCVLLFIFASKVDYHILAKFSLPMLIIGLVLSSLVFLPQFGFSYGGASRWIKAGPLFFQPSEFLKLALVIYAAAWISSKKRDIADFKNGFLPIAVVLAAVGFVLVLQRDISTLGITIASAAALFFLGGGRIKHLLLAFGILGIIFGALIYLEPYRISRVAVFLDSSRDPQGSGYQLRQSMIAIGSGGIDGKGFGRSAQKFNYLPEPVGDSIFAIFAEEFGFIGSAILLSLFLFFLHRGFSIAARAPDNLGRLLGAGIVIIITTQVFVNIAAMIGLFPLSGVPLVFVSKGGSSLIAALVEVGILLNISKHA